MMRKRYGERAFAEYESKNESVAGEAEKYNGQCLAGNMEPIYKFGTGMINDDDVVIDNQSIKIAGLDHAIDLVLENPFEDMV